MHFLQASLDYLKIILKNKALGPRFARMTAVGAFLVAHRLVDEASLGFSSPILITSGLAQGPFNS